MYCNKTVILRVSKKENKLRGDFRLFLLKSNSPQKCVKAELFLQGSSALYAGLGLWQRNSSLMAPAVVSLDPATGSVVWTTVLGQGDRARLSSHWSRDS